MANGSAQFKQFGPFFNASGVLITGIRVGVYAAGGTTPKTYWTSATKSGNNVETGNLDDSDNDGIVSAYFDGIYRFDIYSNSSETELSPQIHWDNVQVTADHGTEWEENFGTALPTANTANRWQQFAKVDASNNLLDLMINTGTSFTTTQPAVLAGWYGAKGDGATDDTTAINNALAAHDVVYLTGGRSTTYIADGIIMKDYNVLKSDGAILKHKASAASHLITINTASNFGYVVIEGLTIDGNNSNNTSNKRLIDTTSGGSYITIRNNNFISVDGIAIYVDITNTTQKQNCVIEGNRFKDFDEEAIFWGGTGDGGANTRAFVNSRISNNYFQTGNSAPTRIINVTAGGAMQELNIDGNIFGSMNVATDGIHLNPGSVVNIFGNHFNAGKTSIVATESDHTNMTGNTFQGVWATTGGGIQIKGCSFSTIVGNYFYGSDGTTTGAGIEVAESATKSNNTVLISGNHIKEAHDGILISSSGGGFTHTGITITGNTININRGRGINVLNNTNSLTITGNEIRSNGLTGIWAASFQSGVISGNNINNNNTSNTATETGVRLATTPNNTTFSSNEVHSNTVGASMTSQIENRFTALDNTGTPSISGNDLFTTGGTTSITNFTGGYPGKKITIVAVFNVSLVNGATIITPTGGNLALVATDVVELVMKADSVWNVTSFSDNT